SPNGQTLMAATSPTSFRLRSGEPWLKLSFNLQDGRAVSMTLEDGGGTQTLTRETAAPAAQVEWKPCTEPRYPKDARCGTYEVFENRAAKSGRKIPLQVVVLPATGPKRLPDPLVYFAGGPGGSAIAEGVGYARDLPELRKDRDFLLIDARGTGPSAQSAPLGCPELDETGGLQGSLEDFMPVDKVRACRDRLQKSADPTQYSNDNVVDDTEEIRTALGYGKLNLMGTSYGARPIQVYMRRHPGSVRAAVMISPVPIDEIFPLVTARHSQRALDLLIAECEGDPACKKAFPKLREEVASVVRRIAKEPVKVQTVDAGTGQPVELTLSKNGFGQVLRRMLYYNNWISLTPLYLHLAANGDWRPLAEMAPLAVGGTGSLGGHLLSIACSEDLAFVRESEIPAAVAGTFLGDLRVRKQLEACQIWPAPKLGPEFHMAVTSDMPTLIFSGEVDPVTPPSSGDRVARGLRRGKHIVVTDAGHGLDGMEGFECVPRTIEAFFAAGSPESLDTSCVAGMRRPDFLLSMDPEVKLKPEELARVTGAWLGQNGLKIRTEAVGGYLRVAFPNGNVLLAATSPTSFRLRSGEPGFLITFGLQGGRAVSMTLEERGETQTLKREEGL
ncbi:MAG TPA: alpha/beta fold hydrolase, partial [Thermoanaerobaculia bacterium]